MEFKRVEVLMHAKGDVNLFLAEYWHARCQMQGLHLVRVLALVIGFGEYPFQMGHLKRSSHHNIFFS